MIILSKFAFPDELEKGLLDGPKVVVEGVVLPRPEVNPHRVSLYLVVSQVEGSVLEEDV